MTPIKLIYHIEIAGIIKNIAAIICCMLDEYIDKDFHANKNNWPGTKCNVKITKNS